MFSVFLFFLQELQNAADDLGLVFLEMDAGLALIQDAAAFGLVDELHKNFAEASGVEFPHDAHVGEPVIRTGEGVARLALVLRQYDARDAHVREFVDGAPGRTYGEIHAFHHAGHDVGGVFKEEQGVVERLDVFRQFVAVRVARPGHDPDGDAALAADRLDRIQRPAGIVGHVRAAEGDEDAFRGRTEDILFGLQELVAQAKIFVPVEDAGGKAPFRPGSGVFVQGVDHLIGQHGPGAFVLEVDHRDVRGLEALHVLAGRVQHIVDHKVGIKRQHVFPQFAPLDDGLVIARGDVGGGEFAFLGTDEENLVVGDFMGQHERTEHMPHADGGIARHHEHHPALREQAFAQPPVLIAVDLHRPVVQEVRYRMPDVAAVQRFAFDDDEGLAFDHQLRFVLGQEGFQPPLMDFPDAVPDAFDGDEAVGFILKERTVGVVDVHPRQQRAACPVHDDVPVVVAQFAEDGFHFRDDVQRGEAQSGVVMEAHAVALADQADFLAVRHHDDVLRRDHPPRRVDGPLDQRDPCEAFDELVRDDRVFLDGRYDDAAPRLCHGKMPPAARWASPP